MNNPEFLIFGWKDLQNTYGEALVYKDLGIILESYCPFNDENH